MTTADPTLDFRQNLKIVPLPSASAFENFQCGESEIDRQFGKVCHWHAVHRSRVFCAYLADDPTLYGFFCLGLHAHDSDKVEGFFSRAVDDKRSFVPFIYLNYLAVRQGFRRRKIGTMLLMSALQRCALVIQQIGSYGIALNPLNDDAASLYDRYGFRTKKGDKSKRPLMVLPAQSVLDLFS